VKRGTTLLQEKLHGSRGPAVGASAIAQPALRLEGSYSGVEKEQAIDIMNESDDGLMVRVKRGDHRAFRILAERYRSKIFRFIHRMLHNEEIAEDLAQETFLRVYRRASTYKPGSNFSIWLYTIACSFSTLL